MAIKLQQFEQIAKRYTEQTYLYKDLALDFQRDFYNAPVFPESVISNDIKSSFDISAIKNSLTNLFNTRPGQRFLFPEYGLDLYQFIFQPITKITGEQIGNLILSKIQQYERRVRPVRINVQGDVDQNTYNIEIIIEVPAFNTEASIVYDLDIRKQAFVSLPTSRNI